MVGLNSVWLLIIALLALAGCVPQTKQTACGSNEAFNSTLRTCVPNTNAPSSYITFSSFIPTSSYSRYKNDLTPMTFRVNISNPYNETYTTRWLVTYNGQTTDVTGLVNSPTQWDIYPLYFVSEVGLHLLTVDVIDSASKVVTSHSFEFTINNSPRPYIDTTSVSPATYSVNLTPNDLTQTYSFNIKNNGASIPAATTYQTQWKLYKNGVDTSLTPSSASQSFTDISVNGFNTSSVLFNPSISTGLGIGTYVLRARLMYIPGNEVVDERQWSISVQNPPLIKVTSRNIVSGLSTPPKGFINAFNGVDYTSPAPANTYNFHQIISAPLTLPITVAKLNAAQANYCVTVASGGGVYGTAGVQVVWYLDGTGGSIYTAQTTAMDNEVCLTDAGNTSLSLIRFDTVGDHTITARVTDLYTGIEYTANEMTPGLPNEYPISWNVRVREQNDKPTAAFGSVDSGLSLCSTSGTVKSSCKVFSDTPITVSFKLSADDFYAFPANEAGFDYSVMLYQDGVPTEKCSKSGTVATFDGTATYSCTMTIPSFNALGPINPRTIPYKIIATIIDSGSPITTVKSTSNTLTWNLDVWESNSSLAATLVKSNASVSEGTSLDFTLNVTDAERDSFDYQVFYCQKFDCSTTTKQLTNVQTYTRSSGTDPVSVPVSQLIDEAFLENVTDCLATDRNMPCAVQFFAVVTDKVSSVTTGTYTAPAAITLPAVSKASSTAQVNIVNINPVPAIVDSFITPLAATNFSNMVGIPFTISAPSGSAVTDSSAVASERVARLQWFVKKASVSTWTSIQGATGNNLIWTPAMLKEADIGVDDSVQLKLCVEDRNTTLAPAVTVATAPACTTGTWQTKVRNNIVTASDLSSSTSMATSASEKGNETAVFQEVPVTLNGVTSSATYVVYVDNALKINVRKVLVKNNGEVLADLDGATQKILSFDALPAAAVVTDIKNLSIAGNGTSLYIAYRASYASAPSAYYPQVRRIDTTAGKITPNIHPGKLGFSYTGITVTNGCSPLTDCTIVNNAAGGAPTVVFSPASTTTGFISFTTPQGTFQYNFAPSLGRTNNQICSDCASAGMAASFAGAINTDTTIGAMGITASTSASTVTILGSTARDYVSGFTDFNRVADDQGDIYIAGSNWYLPFIDSSAGGSDKDKMSVLTGQATGNIAQGSAVTLIAATSSPLNGMVPLTKISTAYNGANLYVAGVMKTGSKMVLYKMDPTGFTFNPATDVLQIMGNNTHSDVRLAVSKTGSASVYAYVTSTTIETPVNNMFAVYGTAAGLAKIEEFKLTDTSNVDNTTAALFYDSSLGTQIKSNAIVAYSGEARFFAASAAGADGTQLFGARLFYDGVHWQLTCKDCRATTTISNKRVSNFARVNASPIRFKDTSTTDYTLGSQGATLNQNYRDIVMVTFGQATLPGLGSTSPSLGVFDIQLESINSTSLDTVDPDQGHYRPPYFKN